MDTPARHAAGFAAAAAAAAVLMANLVLPRAMVPPPSAPATAPLARPHGPQAERGDALLPPAAPSFEASDRAVAAAPRARVRGAFGAAAMQLGAPSAAEPMATDGFALEALHVPDRDAIELLLMGKTDFAVVATPLSEHDEQQGLRGALLGVELWALAVAEENPSVSLRSQQVRQLLTGQLQDWRHLGRGPQAITLVVPANAAACERGTRALIRGDWMTAAQATGADDRAVLDYVQTHPESVGVVRAAAAAEHPGVRLLAIDGVAPSVDAWRRGRYPSGLPLLVATRGAAAGGALRYCEAARAAGLAAGLSAP